MRNLLWKDFWQNSRVILAVGIVAAIPYAVVLGMMAGEMVAHPSDPTAHLPSRTDLIEAIKGSSAVSLGLCILMAAFIGGNAIAGERADRSAEFAAGLPIPRGKALASKAMVAVIPCMAMWAINAAVWLIGRQIDLYAGTNAYRHKGDDFLVLPLCLLGVVAMLCLSWLYSSLAKSPAIAAAAAIGTAVGLYVGLMVLASSKGLPDAFLLVWLPIAVLAMSLLTFAAGAEITRRRVES
jgi:ABC-type transport system involved in multi-copper enzyme maturation permease subunit